MGKLKHHKVKWLVQGHLFNQWQSKDLRTVCLTTTPCYTEIWVFWRTGSQDESIGRYTLPPHTSKRRTTNLKTKNNKNCQKIELYGNPTTKELKKKHSLRLVGGVETGSRGRQDTQQGGGWWTRRSHICVWINWEEPLCNLGFQCRKREPQNLWL